MGTFECHERCDEFCGKKTLEKSAPCSDPFWTAMIKGGKPVKWNGDRDVAREWSAQEKRRVIESLLRMPDMFKLSSLQGIYRLRSPSGQMEMGWKRNNRNQPPVRDPARATRATDSLDSPDEEFANSIEYFLFEPEALKSRTPVAHQWLAKQFGSKLKLFQTDSRGCRK